MVLFYLSCFFCFFVFFVIWAGSFWSELVLYDLSWFFLICYSSFWSGLILFYLNWFFLICDGSMWFELVLFDFWWSFLIWAGYFLSELFLLDPGRFLGKIHWVTTKCYNTAINPLQNIILIYVTRQPGLKKEVTLAKLWVVGGQTRPHSRLLAT